MRRGSVVRLVLVLMVRIGTIRVDDGQGTKKEGSKRYKVPKSRKKK
jgi:hypothetical protein